MTSDAESTGGLDAKGHLQEQAMLEVESVTESEALPDALPVLPSPARCGRISPAPLSPRPRSADDCWGKASPSRARLGAGARLDVGWAWALDPTPSQIGRSEASSRSGTPSHLPSLPRPATSDGIINKAEVVSLPDMRYEPFRLMTPSQDVGKELRRLMDASLRRSREAWTEQTFLCLVCFENQRDDQRLCLAECQAVGHGCCLQCAASFFRSRIEQGRVFELPCPVGAAEGGCFVRSRPGTALSAAFGEAGAAVVAPLPEVARASEAEVRRCLAGDSDTLERYRRFLKTKVDPSLRECPDCKHLCSPVLESPSGSPVSCVHCPECGSEFCYYHAAAHRGGSCEEYERRLAAETKCISEAFGTKDCPRCSRQTMKGGGCNHMTCQVCRCEWCWICGEHLVRRGPHGEGPVYWHYSEENVLSGCQQFAEAGTHPNADEVRLRRRDRMPGPLIKHLSLPVGVLSVALLTIAAILALALWLVLYFVSFCVAGVVRLLARGAYVVRRAEPPETLSEAGAHRIVKSTLYFAVTLGMVAFLVPFTVLTLAWDVLSVVIWIVLNLLGRLPLLRRCGPTPTRHHLRFLLSAPPRAVHRFGSSLLASLADGRANAGRIGVDGGDEEAVVAWDDDDA